MKRLERSVNLTSTVAISISSMLGSGIFVLPALAIMETGSSSWLAYLLAAVCVLPAALSKSELATAMPTSGGTYVYLERTFGPLVGTVSGLGLWLSLLLKSAFALIGFGAYLTILANVPIHLTAYLSLLVIMIINMMGVSKVGKSLLTIVIITISGLSALIVSSFLLPGQVQESQFLTNGLDGLGSAIALVFVSFAGVTKVAAIAEEIKKPEINIPRGILISLLIVTTLYVGINYALVKVLPIEAFNDNLAPLYTLSYTLGGGVAGVVISVLAIITMISMANAGILAASRFPFAMSRDRLLPSFLGKINNKYLTPTWSIFCSAIIVALCISFFEVKSLAKLASGYKLVMFGMLNVVVIILRETRVQWYQPKYKSPMYPWVQIFGILSVLILLYEMGNIVFLSLLGIGIPGILLFLFYSRTRTQSKGIVGIRGRRKDLFEQTPPPSSYSILETVIFQEDASVIVPLFGHERSPELLVEMGVALSEDKIIEVAHVTEVPEQTDLADMSRDTAKIRSLRRRFKALSEAKEVNVKFDPIVSRDIFKTIYELSQRLHCQWLLKEWTGRLEGGITFHNPMGWLRDHLHCHLATFRNDGINYIKKIMIIVRNESIDEFVINTADHLARVNNADMTLIKAIPSDSTEETSWKENEYIKKLAEACESRVDTLILKGNKTQDILINATIDFDLVVFGVKDVETIYTKLFGTFHDKLMAKAACSVLSIRPYVKNN